MGLSDVLAGFAEAGHQHRTNLLNMQFEQAKDLGDKYFQIAQDPNSPPEVRDEAQKRVIGLHTLEPGKKVPKEWSDFTFTIPPKPQMPDTQLPAVPAPSPMQSSGVDQSGLSTGAAPSPGPMPGMPPIAPAQTVAAPPPTPPQQVSMGQKYTPEQLTQQVASRAGAVAAAQEPSKIAEALAAKEAATARAKELANQRIRTEFMKQGQVALFDENNDFIGQRPMTKEEQSGKQTADIAKTGAQANQAQSVADVNKKRIEIGALAKTPASTVQEYNAYVDEMEKLKKTPDTIDKFIERVHPSNAAMKTYMVHAVDQDPNSPNFGKPVNMIVSNTVGASYLAPPTAAQQNRTQQAATVMPVIDDALETIKNNPGIVGPIRGRIENGLFIGGDPDPKYARLRTILGSVAAMMPILHGFRGGSQALDHFSTLVGDPHLTAESMNQMLFELKRLSLEIQTGKAVPINEDTGEPLPQPRGGGATPTPPPGTTPKKPLSSFGH